MKKKRPKLVLVSGQQIMDCVFLYEEPHRVYSISTERRGRFRCKCGKEFSNKLWAIISGTTKSCGCANKNRKRRVKHGDAIHGKRRREYTIWAAMKYRCNNENSDDYKYYGGRGVSVCERWNSSYENFLTDMGLSPSKLHTIDRIDSNGNYEPTNCKWATRAEQSANRRCNRIITYNGESMIISKWADRIGMSPKVLYCRIIVCGWEIKDAFETPVRFRANSTLLKI